MKRLAFVALCLACSSTDANATVTTFTSSSDFFAANPAVTLIEDFEDSDPAIRDYGFPSYTGPRGEISFTAVSSFPFTPNVAVDRVGHMDVAADLAPSTSVMLAAVGNEDWIATLANPSNALGFDVLLNYWPRTITFFSGSTVVGTISFDPSQDSNHRAFAGIDSTDPITSFHWEATNAEYLDTGIDNIYAGPLSGVPEPSTWAMMLLGFGAVGFRLRRARRPIAQAA